jgi:hypothetical protein
MLDARAQGGLTVGTQPSFIHLFEADLYSLKGGEERAKEHGELAGEREKRNSRMVGDKKSAHCIRPRLLSEYLSFIKASSLNLGRSIKSLSAMHPLS